MLDQTICVSPKLCMVLLVLPCPGNTAPGHSDESVNQYLPHRGSYSLPDSGGGEMNKPRRDIGQATGACRRG